MSTANAATIEVRTPVDELGGGPRCSLREAVHAANQDLAFGGCRAGAGADRIVLRKGAIYQRSLDGMGEDGNETGDIDIGSRIAIAPKKGTATIDATGMDRVIHVLETGDLTLSKVRVTGASETYPASPPIDGAGIKNEGRLKTSRVRIVGNETLGNSSNNGGGLNTSGVAILDRTTIAGNTADNVGGGVSMYEGVLRVRRSSIVGNESGYLGGGLYLGGSLSERDVVVIKDSTIAGNVADQDGGGMWVDLYQDVGTDTATLSNVTVSGNSTDGSGGGIYQNIGGVTLRSSTITGNTADADASGTGHGGGLANSISFSDSIVAGNFDRNPVDPQADCTGIGSQGHSVVGKDTGCIAGPTDRTRGPKLRPLRRNGGPTATHALRKGSPAVGLASNASPRRDQRGKRRDRRPDSGAYERVKRRGRR